MKNLISKSGVYTAASRTLKTRKPEVVAIMRKYGMNISDAASEEQLDKAFFALLPRSRGFRKDFSVLASEVASNMTVGELNMSGHLNATGKPTFNTLLSDKAQKELANENTGDIKTFETTTVGKLLSNEAVQNLLNTGLSVWAYKKTGGGVGSYQDSLLNTAQVNGQQGKAPFGAPPDDNQPKPNKGSDVGTIVIVAVSLIAVAAGYLIYKKVKG
jgi:hypothetical protein